MIIKTAQEFREAIANGPYAWPGGYPVCFVTSDGAALSFHTADNMAESIAHSITDDINDGWKVIAVDINWEDPELYCDHTGERIESAYADQ